MVSEALIRSSLGMPAAIPASADITLWVAIITAMATAVKTNPPSDIVDGLILNRIGALWNERQKLTGDSDVWKTGRTVTFEPLSEDEMKSLTGNRSVWWS